MVIKKKLLNGGADTLRVTLPIQWVRHHNLVQGDEITIDMIDDRLIIKPVNPRKKEAE